MGESATNQFYSMNRLIEPNRVVLKAFFHYYGGKTRLASAYSFPKYKIIIEPFAGAAGYASNHSNLAVRLYDKSTEVCGVWDYLIHVKESELLKLPLDIFHVNDLKCCQEAKWFIGFWWNPAADGPRKQPASWFKDGRHFASTWGSVVRARIAGQLKYI